MAAYQCELDPRWKTVAELQAQAWEFLAINNPNYKSGDVEGQHHWRQARKLAEEIMQSQ